MFGPILKSINHNWQFWTKDDRYDQGESSVGRQLHN